MNKIVEIAIAIILLVIVSGCVGNNTPSPNSGRVDVAPIVTANVPIPTPISTPSSKVLIYVNAYKVDNLTRFIKFDGSHDYAYPNPGMMFLVMNLKIINQGHQMIKVSDFGWDLKVSTKDNPYAFTTVPRKWDGEEDGIVCKNSDLEDGGWVYCKLPFEVPVNMYQYRLYWNNPDVTNIDWQTW